MLTPERLLFPRHCYTAPERSASWDGSITRLHSWPPALWNGTGALLFLRSRRALTTAAHRKLCWIRRDTWTFPPRPSAPCRCWTTPSWSAAARTGCSLTRRRCGNCWNATTCRCAVSSTRWLSPGPTGRQFWNSSRPGSAAAAWTFPGTAVTAIMSRRS